MSAFALDETFRRHEGDDASRWLNTDLTHRSPVTAPPAPMAESTATALITQCAQLFERAHLSAWFVK
jgi:hypothetical protein